MNRSTFLEEARDIIFKNLSNEQFGVSELADAVHMSRSNLLRKIKKETQLSASQFIRKIRLEEAVNLLKETDSTVSEVSYQIGFGSPSYFIKCFREEYGFSPGEIHKEMELSLPPQQVNDKQRRYFWPVVAIVGVLLIMAAYFFISKKEPNQSVILEKSIAVLPFKNESSDSTNLYFVNGLMESALNNLQKIEDLKVISRTSVEKYRRTQKNVQEIAQELNVNYLVEGSGQRVGNTILLHIQLIDATTDTPIWSEQYNQEVVDIFSLQNDVAKRIADAIKAVVTPAELAQIEKKPTDNLEAYEYYLRALDPYYLKTKEGLEEAIPLFEKAVEHDPTFALAYANLAISYYFLDINRRQKNYTELINNYADKALLYDAKNDVSLIAKALYYVHTDEYRLAVPHLEKALEYNPNSADVVQVLSTLYNSYIPDTAKYLKYALIGIQLDIAANDSVAKSYIYLTLSNALAQTGFIKEASKYIDKSLEFDPKNAYAPYLKAYIKYAENGDMEQTKKSLIKELEKDSTRLDILQEVAKLHYFQRDYEGAYTYYKAFVEARNQNNLKIYPQEDLKISLTYSKVGKEEKAREFYNAYAIYCEQDVSMYKSASIAMKYSYDGRIDEAIDELKNFATQDHFQYWILLFLEEDPLIEPLKTHPKYAETIQKIKDRFWENQSKLRETLEHEGLL
ncbi:helix-turn-helix domain-containing protein [Maribacter flavus]|uniref:helix-turn-helix domain-containing protein n=1 Tax=Maribacter flavus TaxID=1658664 RepID=UPI001FE515BA|nr:helix-turn-helix domain-containing protein [Maribacter flavus]